MNHSIGGDGEKVLCLEYVGKMRVREWNGMQVEFKERVHFGGA